MLTRNLNADSNLGEFGYKILHRILVTNKELRKFKIRNDDLCDECKNPDSLEHTFLQCPVTVIFYHEILSWFNVSHNTLINLSPEQIGPLQLAILLVQNRHAGTQKSHWDKTNKGNYHLK